jgi:putative ABC transport system ATP-binding protein
MTRPFRRSSNGLMSDLQLSMLRKTYGGGLNRVVALDGVSVVARPGSFTAVMGPSGSGKSTLLLCAAGLERPSSGTVVLGGVDLTRLAESALTRLRRDRIGFVFQSFNLVASLTAGQNVGLPLRLAGRKPGPGQIAAALAAVGLADRGGGRPSELSGGQQQRVAIARALITEPAVLFADEPTGALDSANSREFLSLLDRLVAERGQTTVVVTHDPIVAAHADTVVFLSDGRIADRLDRPSAHAIARAMTRLEAGPC